jgi:acyl-CoA synthetase (AMP-forming)/AMP-acid ligase II
MRNDLYADMVIGCLKARTVPVNVNHDYTPREVAELLELQALCTEQLARFKAPKEFVFVDRIRRLGNGKADYRWAKNTATQQVSVI